MPKIIENIEEEITQKALNLFKKGSYKKVSMRKIANEAGIAVGTLYNYYPNKFELYIEVFEESWKETYQILRDNCKKQDKRYLKNFIEILYSEMKKRKFIVRELFRYIMNDLEINEKEQKEKINRVRFPNVVINQIYELFISVLEKEYKIKLDQENENLYRLFTTLQTEIPLLEQNFNDQNENIEFLYNILNSYAEKSFYKK